MKKWGARYTLCKGDQQWGWEFTFHTVLQCFCNLYYSTCFWAKWFVMANKWFFWHLVMGDDEVMWKSLKRSSYNTKCTIFYHSSIYIAIQNIQNVQYSTIPKYTKYTKYTKCTIFYHSSIYIAIFTCYMIFAAFIEQNLARAC